MSEEENAERADKCFEELIQYSQAAALLDNAAGYNVAINGLKYAASILNPKKYGKQVLDAGGNVAGYIIETGIRRTGDAGHTSGGVLDENQAGSEGTSVHSETTDFGGQDNSNGMGVDE